MMRTVRPITPLEYRRRVFNKVLMECMIRLQECILDGTKTADAMDESTRRTVRSFTEAFYTDQLQLNKRTIAQTRKLLEDADEFVQDAMDTAEKIADDKKATVEEEKISITDGDEVQLSDEDEEVIDQVFNLKRPDPQIDKIRDATISALVAEDQKSQELRQAVEIAQEQSEEENNPKIMEECVKRINNIGPTSLMNGLINYFSTQAVKSVNESSGEGGAFGSIAETMRENREIIKDRAVIMYSLFEAANSLHITHFTKGDVEKLAREFYYGK